MIIHSSKGSEGGLKDIKKHNSTESHLQQLRSTNTHQGLEQVSYLVFFGMLSLIAKSQRRLSVLG